MSFVDQLKDLEKNVPKDSGHTYIYDCFLSSHFMNAVRNTCIGNVHEHTLKGFYYAKYGYDRDDYGFTEEITEATHIRDKSLENADLTVLKQEMVHKFQSMGFRVIDVQITKHRKQIQVFSGYGFLGRKKQYKPTDVDYLRIYIHIEW